MNPEVPSESTGCLFLGEFIAVNTLTTKSNSPPQVSPSGEVPSKPVESTFIGDSVDEQSDKIPPKDPPPSA
jgi:hypothetical protein